MIFFLVVFFIYFWMTVLFISFGTLFLYFLFIFIYLVLDVLTKLLVEIVMLHHSFHSFCFLCSMIIDRISKEEQYGVEWPCTIFGILTLLVNKGVFLYFFPTFSFTLGTMQVLVEGRGNIFPSTCH